MKLTLLETYVGCNTEKWLFAERELSESNSAITLFVYTINHHFVDQGYFTDDDEYHTFEEIIAKQQIGVSFEDPHLGKYLLDEESAFGLLYLEFFITYKHMFPTFPHDGHRHAFQWSNQMDVLHHCQLLQLCLKYAHDLGGMLAQQDIDMLKIDARTDAVPKRLQHGTYDSSTL